MLDTAYPGDIIGLVNASALRVGDTLTLGYGQFAIAIPERGVYRLSRARLGQRLDVDLARVLGEHTAFDHAGRALPADELETAESLVMAGSIMPIMASIASSTSLS